MGSISAAPSAKNKGNEIYDNQKQFSGLQYAPVLFGINRNTPSVVYDPPVMKTTLPKVDMSKYASPIVTPTPYREINMSDYYNDLAANQNTSVQFGFKFPKFRRRRRKRIYIM